VTDQDDVARGRADALAIDADVGRADATAGAAVAGVIVDRDADAVARDERLRADQLLRWIDGRVLDHRLLRRERRDLVGRDRLVRVRHGLFTDR